MYIDFNGKKVHVRMRFEPIMDRNNSIYAMELLSRLYYSDGSRLSSSEFFKYASQRLKKDIFLWQIEVLLRQKEDLKKKGVVITVNVDSHIAEYIVNDSQLQNKLKNLHPWLALEISKHFLYSDERLIFRLSFVAPLWLDDFGKENANFDLLNSGLFTTVKIDASLFHSLSSTIPGSTLLRALCDWLNDSDTDCIIEGVETSQLHNIALGCQMTGMQGYFWPGLDDIIISSKNKERINPIKTEEVISVLK